MHTRTHACTCTHTRACTSSEKTQEHAQAQKGWGIFPGCGQDSELTTGLRQAPAQSWDHLYWSAVNASATESSMPTAPHPPPRPARAEPSENVRVRGRGGACLGKPAFSSELWEGGTVSVLSLDALLLSAWRESDTVPGTGHRARLGQSLVLPQRPAHLA